MARKRMIDPEFWSDEAIGQWSDKAKLFYIGLWNFSDDAGRFKAHSSLLRSQIFPYDQTVDIDALKTELGNKIQWYAVGGSQYGFVRNFLKHQRIDRPTASHLPAPESFDEPSTSPQRDLAPNISKVKLSKVKGREVVEQPHQSIINRYLELSGTARESLTREQVTGAYKRHSRSALALISEAGGLDHALNALEVAAAYFTKKSLTWTLDTVAKHLPKLEGYRHELLAERNGLTRHQLDQLSQLATWYRSKTQPGGTDAKPRAVTQSLSNVPT